MSETKKYYFPIQSSEGDEKYQMFEKLTEESTESVGYMPLGTVATVVEAARTLVKMARCYEIMALGLPIEEISYVTGSDPGIMRWLLRENSEYPLADRAAVKFMLLVGLMGPRGSHLHSVHGLTASNSTE